MYAGEAWFNAQVQLLDQHPLPMLPLLSLSVQESP